MKTKKGFNLSNKPLFTEDDIDTKIEPVTYEQNQELLRAFGG
jgi:hypothetical protein